jgi:hypothetical protein
MSDSAQESQKRHFSKIRPHVLVRILSSSSAQRAVTWLERTIDQRLWRCYEGSGTEEHVERRDLAVANYDYKQARVAGRFAARPNPKPDDRHCGGPGGRRAALASALAPGRLRAVEAKAKALVQPERGAPSAGDKTALNSLGQALSNGPILCVEIEAVAEKRQNTDPALERGRPTLGVQIFRPTTAGRVREPCYSLTEDHAEHWSAVLDELAEAAATRR